MAPDRFEYALTPMQHGMLYHTLRAPRSGVYMQQVEIQVSGELDIGVFRRVWQELAGRHAALRTSFECDGRSEPAQIVHPNVTIPFIEQDWRHRTEAEQAAALERFLEEDRVRDFDLSRAPLMRLSALRIGNNGYRLIWSMHHALLDGWSVYRVLAEAFQLYEACRAGRSLRLSTPRPFCDYVDWLGRQDLTAAEIFWRDELKGFTAPTRFEVDHRIDRARGADQDTVEFRVQISAEMTQAFRALARQQRVTLNTLVQGSWALLMSRYSGEEDVIFGITVSGRPSELAGVDSMIGLFINTLPLRVRASPEASLQSYFSALLRKQTRLQQYAYTPLTRAQSWSDVPPGLPLFESVLVFQNLPTMGIPRTPVRPEHSDNAYLGQWLDIGPIDMPERTGYPLTVVVEPDTEIAVRLIHDRRRFDGDVIERMAGHLQTLMSRMVANPRARLSELSLLAPSERRVLTTAWNETGMEYPRDQCVHGLFEAQVERTPDAAALKFGDTVLTYQELNRRANMLAHYLHQRGVGPEVLVGIYLDRSLDLIVALLGILKAGGAYVPIDPSYPAERIAFMLHESAVPFVLTDAHLLSRLPEHSGTMFCMDRDWALLADQPCENPLNAVRAEDLAYVIYTSGSTGKPKGVMAMHRGVINRLWWMWRTYPFESGDVLCQKTSISFVDHVWEIFGPLLQGVPLIVISQEIAKDPVRLINVLTSEKVTRIVLVPSLLRILLDTLESLPFPSPHIKYWQVSGEPLDVSLLARCCDSFPGATVLNLYGSTEVAGDATWYDSRDPRPAYTVPIGRPIANTQVFILNEHGQQVPAGVPGELHVGGDGLARGYLNEPELTAQKFIRDPITGEPGSRLYKTGDIGRYLSDGSIELQGRLDRQIKIRGIRIEPGEIEEALVHHPGVREACVLARECAPGVRRLVAYVAPVHEPPSAEELRLFLRPIIPDYMMPSAFVTVAGLPRGPHGKVDVEALPNPDPTSLGGRTEYVAPRTMAEQTLVTIWQDVLQAGRVGVLDRFFELGGDSLLGMQIVARAKSAGLSFTIQQFFAFPTIAELVAVAGTVTAVTAEQGIITGPVPIMPRQRGVLETNGPGPLRFASSPPLRAVERLDPVLLEQAVAAVVAHHDTLRMAFTHDEQGWHQSNLGLGDYQIFSSIDLGDRSQDEQLAAMREMAALLRESPIPAGQLLFRVIHFDLGPRRPSAVILSIHHLLFDGLSMRILFEDIAAAYRQLQCGVAVQLPPKTTSFKAWATRLYEYAQSEELAREIPYWLSEARQRVAPVPVDHPDARVTPTPATPVTIQLDRAETRAILRELPAHYGTEINDVLLTALVLAGRAWVGSSSVLVDLSAHGREGPFPDLDVSRTVGLLTTVFPVLLDVGGATEASEALQQVKEQLRAIPNRGIGYELLRYLRDDPELATGLQQQPGAHFHFGYQGQLDQAFAGSSLFQPPAEASRRTRPGEQTVRPELWVRVQVLDERLSVDFWHSTDLYERSTIERLAQRYADVLRQLTGQRFAGQTVGLASR